MIVGVPKEIKNNEYRVALVPAGARALIDNGHKVLIEKFAGEGSGISDEEYQRVGAKIVSSPQDVFGETEMVVKVKEPLPEEYDFLHEGCILFTYLHLAPALELTKALLARKVIGIAYETVELEDGSLPLLTPMSEIAGRISIQVGAYFLQKDKGGSGVLLGGVPGVKAGKVAVIGAGVVGTNAAQMALGLGANVTILTRNVNRLRYLKEVLHGNLTTLVENSVTIEAVVREADLVIGGVYNTGAKAPCLITRDMLSGMKEGSVIVDVSIDQGGCCETSKPTTHADPVYTVDGVLHYCVANMPSVVSRTSTFALTNVTLPYVIKLADLGCKEALQTDKALRKGLNIYQGLLVNEPVAESLGLKYTPLQEI